jgi:hypothetical protein
MHLRILLAMSVLMFLVGCKVEVGSNYAENQKTEALPKHKSGYIGFSAEDLRFVKRVQLGIDREGIDYYIRQTDEEKTIYYPEEFQAEVEAIISHAAHSLAPSPDYTGLCTSKENSNAQAEWLTENDIPVIRASEDSRYCVYWLRSDSERVESIDPMYKLLRENEAVRGNDI